eukprot:232993_1
MSTTDVIICVGSTGTGKSTLIKLFCNKEATPNTSNAWHSCTKTTAIYTDEQRMFVDTIGAESSNKYIHDNDMINKVMQVLSNNKLLSEKPLQIKLLWFVKPDERMTSTLQTQAKCIRSLDPEIWKSTVIVVKESLFNPGHQAQGAIAAAIKCKSDKNKGTQMSARMANSDNHKTTTTDSLSDNDDDDWKDTFDIATIGFTQITALSSDDPRVQLLDHIPDNTRISHGLLYDNEIKENMNKLLTSIPFSAIQINIKQCSKCNIIGDKRWIIKKCHPQIVSYHSKKHKLIHPKPFQTTHSPDATVIKYHPQSTTVSYHPQKTIKYHATEDVERYHPSHLQPYHPNSNMVSYHPKSMIEFHSSYLEHYHPAITANNPIECTIDLGTEYKHNGALQPGGDRLCPCPSGRGMFPIHHGVRPISFTYSDSPPACYNCGRRVVQQYQCTVNGVICNCDSCLKTGPLQWSCCGKKEGSDGCSPHQNSMKHTKYVYQCCGRDNDSEGCKQRYKCCQHDQYQSKGCQKRYECCSNSNQSSEGCKMKYSCCNQNMDSQGCKTKYFCCDGNDDAGCKQRYVCCKLNVENATGCKEKYDCCSKPLNSDGCSTKYSCCDEAIDSVGCKQKYSCCNTSNDGCLEFYPCCKQTQYNSKGCCYECCIQPIDSAPCVQKCSSCNKPMGTAGCAWKYVQHDMMDINELEQTRNQQKERKQNIRQALMEYKKYKNDPGKGNMGRQNRRRGGRGYNRGRGRSRGRGRGRSRDSGRDRGRDRGRGYNRERGRGSYRRGNSRGYQGSYGYNKNRY